MDQPTETQARIQRALAMRSVVAHIVADAELADRITVYVGTEDVAIIEAIDDLAARQLQGYMYHCTKHFTLNVSGVAKTRAFIHRLPLGAA